MYWLVLVCLLGQDVESGIPKVGYQTSSQEMVVLFDPMTRNPRAVVELVTPKILEKNVARNRNPFHPDPSIPEQFRVSPRDYTNSGFNRGHMAPAGNHFSSEDSLYRTFLMSNMVPQYGSVNSGIWMRLEDYCRTLFLEEKYEIGWIVTCPIYDSSQIGRVNGSIWVPSHTGKALLFKKTSSDGIPLYLLLSFIVPNENRDIGKDFMKYKVSADYFESKAGLDLWPQFPQLEKLESVP